MCSIWMTGELNEILIYRVTHQLILLIICKELYEGLNRMSPLFIPNNIRNILMKTLHNLQSLSIGTHTE